jgi:ribosomal protein L12E/L44/L45/RPP1/RPP2
MDVRGQAASRVTLLLANTHIISICICLELTSAYPAHPAAAAAAAARARGVGARRSEVRDEEKVENKCESGAIRNGYS